MHIEQHLPDASVRVLFKVGAVFRGEAVISADGGDVGMGADMLLQNIRQREVGHQVALHQHHIILPDALEVVYDAGQRLHPAPELAVAAPPLRVGKGRQQRQSAEVAAEIPALA